MTLSRAADAVPYAQPAPAPGRARRPAHRRGRASGASALGVRLHAARQCRLPCCRRLAQLWFGLWLRTCPDARHAAGLDRAQRAAARAGLRRRCRRRAAPWSRRAIWCSPTRRRCSRNWPRWAPCRAGAPSSRTARSARRRRRGRCGSRHRRSGPPVPVLRQGRGVQGGRGPAGGVPALPADTPGPAHGGRPVRRPGVALAAARARPARRAAASRCGSSTCPRRRSPAARRRRRRRAAVPQR